MAAKENGEGPAKGSGRVRAMTTAAFKIRRLEEEEEKKINVKTNKKPVHTLCQDGVLRGAAKTGAPVPPARLCTLEGSATGCKCSILR